ncbi:MAG: hypothetical protein ACF8Q5_07890 [Phycisphaerales bacterium JB040]
MIDSIKTGSQITCTITSEPRAASKRLTIARLMRRDPANARALRKGQEDRRRSTPTKIRGGRTWYIRPKAGKVCIPRPGNSWTMKLTPDLVNDLKAVEPYLSIEKNA